MDIGSLAAKLFAARDGAGEEIYSVFWSTKICPGRGEVSRSADLLLTAVSITPIGPCGWMEDDVLFSLLVCDRSYLSVTPLLLTTPLSLMPIYVRAEDPLVYQVDAPDAKDLRDMARLTLHGVSHRPKAPATLDGSRRALNRAHGRSGAYARPPNWMGEWEALTAETQALQWAFHDGELAYVNGIPPSTGCPYAADELRERWAAGWTAASKKPPIPLKP